MGNRPLLRLRSVTQGIAKTADVLAKVEYLNPGGSVKDRIALRMVETAQRTGKLTRGRVIVEPTSGNTGVGLAIVAQERGYRCIFTCPDKVAADKVSVLRAYGAEVVVCPTSVPPEHPESYYSVARRLAKETPGGWQPDQYANPDNPAAHYHWTGPEIWRQTEGRITHLVAGIGTRGGNLRTRPVPQGGLRRPGPGYRGRPRGLGLLRRDRPPLPGGGGRRGHLAGDLRQEDRRRGDRGQRRRLVQHDPPPRPGRGPAGRRLLRPRGGGRPAGGGAGGAR